MIWSALPSSGLEGDGMVFYGTLPLFPALSLLIHVPLLLTSSPVLRSGLRWTQTGPMSFL